MIARLVLRRIAIGAMQMAALAALVFFVIRLMPADPAARFVGLGASPEAYAAARATLGLDKPLLAQFADFLGFGAARGLIDGDLGRSWVSGESVAREIAAALPITLELVACGVALAVLAAFPIALLSARRPGGGADRAVLIYGLFAGSQPEFVWALGLVFVFFAQLGLAPGPLGRLSPFAEPPEPVTGFMTIDTLLAGRFEAFSDAVAHLALPAATLAIVLSGPIIKMLRDSLGRALKSDHVLFARASGLSENRVSAIALKSALAPTLALIGILFGFMLGGAVLVESVFALGGLGQYAVRSVLAFDYPAIQGVVLTIAAVSLLVYLITDAAQALIDPRVAT
ncbi:MAG: ABC transporter permease [Hyphomonadaceae bacterium]|nr:ABC transporter permease [Hyphomonadaceae bacterium]